MAAGTTARVVDRTPAVGSRVAMTDQRLTDLARPLHVGRTTVVVVTDVARSDGKLVTRTTRTQAVLPGA
jgi:acyl-coenzyme A thioesterase PaaI-like protein